ncbi:HopJ type III effector protein [Oceanicoccus sp. KOV_DT_Chl]|uniref:HopJ type III effector protein n=1 Tax=Oceanicoccus sp. KOV_DT_Chl TaxID=1904639 RepID=UPI000C7BD4A0|nr:HopJ type III effector protein [Oceanicoccus sp. KOV_DT_Chl]
MSIEHFLKQLQQHPDSIEFDQTMNVIGQHFDYSPSRFTNGPTVINEAGTNEGSCKIFAFAQLMNLDQSSTLACFGKFYREEVLQQPNADNHGNIRAFMQYGWEGIHFHTTVLTPVQAAF